MTFDLTVFAKQLRCYGFKLDRLIAVGIVGHDTALGCLILSVGGAVPVSLQLLFQGLIQVGSAVFEYRVVDRKMKIANLLIISHIKAVVKGIDLLAYRRYPRRRLGG